VLAPEMLGGKRLELAIGVVYRRGDRSAERADRARRLNAARDSD